MIIALIRRPFASAKDQPKVRSATSFQPAMVPSIRITTTASSAVFSTAPRLALSRSCIAAMPAP